MNPLFPIEYILIFFGAVVLLGGYLSYRSSMLAPQRTRIVITVLRVAALLSLAIIAFDPGYWKVKKEDQTSEWAVLLDSSASMKVKDIDGASRFNAGKKVAEKILQNIENAKIYPFSNDLEKPLSSKEELNLIKPDGTATDITKSGSALLRRYSEAGKKLKGIIIVSDGRETITSDSDKFAILARAKSIPLNGICLGGKVKDKDLELKLNHTNFTLFKGQTQNIMLDIVNRNLGKIKTTVKLTDKSGKLVESKEVHFNNNQKKSLTFTVHLNKPGLHEMYFETPLLKEEKIKNNNRVAISFTVLDEKLKVLMVEGRPFWDSKFLSQVLRNNKNIDFTGIYRLSPDRFFLLHEGDNKGKESATVIFPDSLEKIAEYNLIIFGKGAEFFLDDKKIALLKRYIRDFGGAVLFARGKPYSGDWDGLSAIEPVYWGETLNNELRWKPTEAGKSYGLFGEMLPDANAQIWQELPLVEQASRCPELKSFAEVLLVGKSENSKLEIPVLITRKIGKGVSLAVNSEGLWKWDFFPLKGDVENFYRTFWTQLVFWSVKYSDFLPNQNYSIHLSRSRVLPGEEVVAFINTREKFKKDLNITVRITKQNKLIREILPAASLSGRGWNGLFSLPEPGRYRISLVIPGKKVDSIFASLEVKAPPAEKDNLSADPEKLKSLINLGGGKLLSIPEIIELMQKPETMQKEKVESEKKWRSAWNRWYLLLALLAFFSTECYLRRRNGML